MDDGHIAFTPSGKPAHYEKGQELPPVPEEKPDPVIPPYERCQFISRRHYDCLSRVFVGLRDYEPVWMIPYKGAPSAQQLEVSVGYQGAVSDWD